MVQKKKNRMERNSENTAKIGRKLQVVLENCRSQKVKDLPKKNRDTKD